MSVTFICLQFHSVVVSFDKEMVLRLIDFFNMKQFIIYTNDTFLTNPHNHGTFLEMMKRYQMMLVNSNTSMFSSIGQSNILIYGRQACEGYQQNKKDLQEKTVVLINDSNDWFSRMDEPIYFLKKNVISEQYQYKSLKKRRILAITQNSSNFVWRKGISKSILERRGNFENLTILGMQAEEQSNCKLPDNYEHFTEYSKVIPKAYEVSTARPNFFRCKSGKKVMKLFISGKNVSL